MARRTIEQQPGAVGVGARRDPRAERARARRQRRLKLTTMKDGDTGAPLLARHHTLADDMTAIDGVEAAVKRVVDQRPIDRYRARGQLSELQWRAADKLAAMAFRAGLTPRVTMRYSDMPKIAGAADDHLGARDVARGQWLDAMAQLGQSSRLAAVVVAVCALEQTAAAWAASGGFYRGQKAAVEGLTTLRLALDRLVAHWRLG